MQLEEIVQPWVRELEGAFAPYPKFLAEVILRLEALEKESASLVDARPLSKKVAPTPTQQNKLPEKRVLLVDDAEINRVLMSHYFRGYPVKLEFAVNADAARAKCAENRYDLVVVDFDSKAIATAEALIPEAKGASILALSPGAFSENEKTAAMGAGFHHYLSRGLPKEELITALHEKLWKSAS